MFAGSAIREALVPYIQAVKPDWNTDSTICLTCLNKARYQLVESHLKQELGELSDVEKEVVEVIRNHELVSENPEEAAKQVLTFGDCLSGRIAEFGGSWTFIIAFSLILIVWVFVNTSARLSRPFDPFPYLLLNLVLSCLDALQAPVIMMSQDRQEDKDRVSAELDYKT